MKKLLSLLSLLTISGTAVPTTIAASPYQKEKTIKNTNINYSKTNNLENLTRNKRYYFPYTNIEQKYISITPKISGRYTSPGAFDDFVSVYTNDYLNWAASRDSIINLAKEKNDNLKNKSIVTESYGDASEVHTMKQDYNFEAKRLDISNNDDDFWSSKTVNVYFRLGNPIIKFLGLHNDYKGEIRLDIQSHKRYYEKIIFFGDDKPFHSYYDGKSLKSKEKIYNKIIIKNQEEQIIKEIIINGTDSMLDIIKKYDLKNGIDCEYGYIIEIWSAEPSRTFYIVNESNKYENTDNTKFKKFIIINDKLLSYDFYEQKYHKLLFEWEKNFNLWKDELNRQLKYVVPQKNIEDKKTWKNEKYLQLIDKLHSLNQNIQIIKNSENISDLKNKVKKLENKINDKFELIFNQLSELQNKIEKIKNSSNDLLSGCSNFFGNISPISSLIPCVGIITSAITGVISGVCTLENS